jgi:hypothetical protein
LENILKDNKINEHVNYGYYVNIKNIENKFQIGPEVLKVEF